MDNVLAQYHDSIRAGVVARIADPDDEIVTELLTASAKQCVVLQPTDVIPALVEYAVDLAVAMINETRSIVRC